MTALLVLVALALAGCSSSSEPSATFTGAACNYDGPSEFDLNSTVTFTFTNESANLSVGFSVLKFPEGSTADEVFNKGMANVVPSDDAFLGFVPDPTLNDTEYDLTVTFVETGQHGVNCFDQSVPGVDPTGADYATMFTVNG
jgi:hypothetical protein